MGAAPRVGLLWRREWDPPSTEPPKLHGVFAAFRELGVEAEPVLYSDDAVEAVREQLLQLDGVLIWVNPVEKGLDRSGWEKLIGITGAGHKDSTTFHIKSKSIQVAYSYSHCPAKGGNLFVDLVRRRGFTRSLVSVQGIGGKKRIWAYPGPGTYHLSISSVCRWYVSVYGH